MRIAANLLVAHAGQTTPTHLTPSEIIDTDNTLAASNYAPATKASVAQGIRRLLRWLWQYHNAPALDGIIRHYPAQRPRNTQITEQEKEALMRHAKGGLRLLILLCSDLAIRSGTAARLGAQHYDAERRTLTFVTKKQERLSVPCTAEVAQMLDRCNPHSPLPFVTQLNEISRPNQYRTHAHQTHQTRTKVWKALLRRAGIHRNIRLHDLRRTTAIRLYEETGDVRDVQALLGHNSLASTIWYLDHDLRPIDRSMLETIKHPARARKEQTA